VGRGVNALETIQGYYPPTEQEKRVGRLYSVRRRYRLQIALTSSGQKRRLNTPEQSKHEASGSESQAKTHSTIRQAAAP
jgi:hypothetical protein